MNINSALLVFLILPFWLIHSWFTIMHLWPDAVTDTVNQSCIDAWVYLLLRVQKSFQFCYYNGESLFHILNLEVAFYILLCSLSWYIKGVVSTITCMWRDIVCVCKKKRTTKVIDNWIEHKTVEWGHQTRNTYVKCCLLFLNLSFESSDMCVHLEYP